MVSCHATGIGLNGHINGKPDEIRKVFAGFQWYLYQQQGVV